MWKNTSEYTDVYGTVWNRNGTLTNPGKRMHYILGIRNRKAYSSLINFNQFNPKEIQIYTTNSTRTSESMLAELYGMYLPGTGEQLTEEELPFSLPPGHDNFSEDILNEVESLGNDTIINRMNTFPIQFFGAGRALLNNPENCPYITEYRLLLKERINESLAVFMKEFDQKFGKKLQKFLNRTDKEFIYNYDKLLPITDDFVANVENGINIDKFYEETNITKEEYYSYARRVKMFYLYNLTADQTSAVMGAKPFMEDLINYMETKIKSEKIITDNEPKMVIHGGHDTTINVIQYFMFTAFDIPVRYATFGTNIYFELYKEEEDNRYTVKYFLDGQLLLNEDYKFFKEKVLKHIWSDKQVHDFCYREEQKQSSSNIVTILIITNIIFFLSTIVFIILYLLSSRKNKESISNSEDLLPNN